MKKFNVFMVVCIAAISSTIANAQDHPFHQPNRGKSVVSNTIETNLSSLDLLPDTPMSKSNGPTLMRSIYGGNELLQNTISDIPLSKMNFPKSLRSLLSTSTNKKNEMPQKPASKINY
jgi:hypothetical protein